jgi:hypothetical protein
VRLDLFCPRSFCHFTSADAAIGWKTWRPEEVGKMMVGKMMVSKMMVRKIQEKAVRSVVALIVSLGSRIDPNSHEFGYKVLRT